MRSFRVFDRFCPHDAYPTFQRSVSVLRRFGNVRVQLITGIAQPALVAVVSTDIAGTSRRLHQVFPFRSTSQIITVSGSASRHMIRRSSSKSSAQRAAHHP